MLDDAAIALLLLLRSLATVLLGSAGSASSCDASSSAAGSVSRLVLLLHSCRQLDCDVRRGHGAL